MLGEIPPSSVLKVYYHLESDGTDSSGNAFTLSNVNSPSFTAGKFSGAVDFGTTGTNKALRNTSYPISLQPSSFSVNFWFKLNTTSDTGYLRMFQITTATSSATGIIIYVEYTIVGGSMTIRGRYGNAQPTITLTPDTNWHMISLRSYSSTSSTTIQIDEGQKTDTGRGNGFSGGTVGTLIGNNPGLTLQAFVKVDEFFIHESNFMAVANIGNRYRYYTQAKGRFCI
jgi:hypothetical protein